jgi:BON domain
MPDLTARLLRRRPPSRREQLARRAAPAVVAVRRAAPTARRVAPPIAALLAACAVGALLQYFLDRQQGVRRRHLARDRTFSKVRRRSRDAFRRAKYMEGVAEGMGHKVTHAVPGVGGHGEAPDDVTLAHKVESVAFRAAHTPKGHVVVNAERGVVHLRGQLDSDDQIEALVRATKAIEGVKDVKNLLHTRS